MRHPNGYGTVVKLSGNRRKPYAVRKTVGWNDKGQPIIKAIGYAETREEGLIMLAEYNKSPYDLTSRKMTVGEVFEKWFSEKQGKRAKNTMNNAQTAWNHCIALSSLPYRNLRTYHVQECIDNCNLSYSVKNAIRSLFVNLDKWAIAHDVIDHGYAELIESIPIPPSQKTIFTPEEIARVWENADYPEMDILLILLYTGWRINELLDMKVSDVDLEAGTMRGGSKTKTGKNRIVPIHPKIKPLLERRINRFSNKLFKVSAVTFRKRWNEIGAKIGINHTPHECRHTFRSALDSAGANKVCIDMLMGHVSQGTGERVYTHKTIDELRVTIGMIPY